MPKIMKAGKVLTSNSLNGEIILSENIRKQNELDRIANEATRANVVEAIEVEYAPRLTGVESQLAERATVMIKKAKGNVADDTKTIQSALLAVSGGGSIKFPADQNYICGSITQELTGNVTLELNGSTITTPNGSLLKLSGVTVVTTALTADAPLNTKEITIASSVGVTVGDIVYVANSTPAETGWNTTKRFLSTVQSIAGNVITLTDKLHFSFSVAETGNEVVVYRPQNITINDLHLVTQTTTNSAQIQLMALNVNMRNVKETNSPNAYGIYLNRCVNSEINDVYVKDGVYPFLINTCRNMRFFNLNNIGEPLRHMIAPGAWSADIFVDGLYGSGGLIESHPAFNVNYKNVNITSDFTHAWNLRSIGGSIKDAVIKHNGNAIVDLSVQRLSLADLTLWENSKFVMDNVTLDTVEAGGTFAVWGSHDIRIQNCTFPEGTVLVSGNAVAGDIAVKKLFLLNNKGLKHVLSRSYIHQVYTDKVISDANLVNGYYEIDSWLNTVVRHEVSRDAIWSNKGKIITENTSADPLVIPLKIFTQTRAGALGFQATYFKIKLTAYLKHANLGGFDIQENIYHGRLDNASGVATLGLTPASLSANTGIASESLTISVGNVTFSGSPQNADGLTHFIAFDVTLTSGRTSPNYSLSYEIDYFGTRT